MKANEFDRSCKQLRKKYNYQSSPELEREVEELFLRSLGQPEEMGRELFDYSVGMDGIDDARADKLSDMIDLFMMEYDDNYNRLNDGDWEYLKELVNGYALDMDMDTVTYVMQKVVDAGVFR